MDGRTDDSVVFISHTNAASDFRVGSHHLARELSRLGYRVLHVSTPFSLVHRLTGRGGAGRALQADAGAATDADGVVQFVPRTVLPAGLSGSRYLSRSLDDLGFAAARFMLVDQPLMATPALSRLARRVVYRPTDLYPDGPAAKRERKFLPFVDGIVATSAEVLGSLPVNARDSPSVPSLVLNNGVEYSRFAVGSGARRSGAVYVGALDYRFDWDAIRQFAAAAPDVPIRLAGPVTSRPGTIPSNVELLGPVAYSAVPELLAGSVVGLLPFSDVRSNQGRSPMKLYEYLSSGLFVLSSRTPVIGSDPIPGLSTYSGRDEATALYRDLVRRDGDNTAGRSVASLEDWSIKARQLEAFLVSLP